MAGEFNVSTLMGTDGQKEGCKGRDTEEPGTLQKAAP